MRKHIVLWADTDDQFPATVLQLSRELANQYIILIREGDDGVISWISMYLNGRQLF